jgi:hypothetical protein
MPQLSLPLTAAFLLLGSVLAAQELTIQNWSSKSWRVAKSSRPEPGNGSITKPSTPSTQTQKPWNG